MKCTVINCPNSQKTKNKKLGFFTFPKDVTIRKEWVRFSRREVYSENQRICSDHFLPEDFENRIGFEMGFAKYRKLKPSAVPTVSVEAKSASAKARKDRIEKRTNKKIVAELLKKSAPFDKKLEFTRVPKPTFAVEVNTPHFVGAHRSGIVKRIDKIIIADPLEYATGSPEDDYGTVLEPGGAATVAEGVMPTSFARSVRARKQISSKLRNQTEDSTDTAEEDEPLIPFSVAVQGDYGLKRSNPPFIVELHEDSIDSAEDDELATSTVYVSQKVLTEKVKELENHIDRLRREKFCLQELDKKHCKEIAALQMRAKKAEFEQKNLEEKLNAIFTSGQIKKLKGGMKRRTWSEYDISYSYTLYSVSSKAYRMLKERGFPLPAIRTLEKWAQKGKVTPAVTRTQ